MRFWPEKKSKQHQKITKDKADIEERNKSFNDKVQQNHYNCKKRDNSENIVGNHKTAVTLTAHD